MSQELFCLQFTVYSNIFKSIQTENSFSACHTWKFTMKKLMTVLCQNIETCRFMRALIEEYMLLV
uniref:Kinesin heavy chain, putative n=1 Tax=Arundo donax TaxID=35708 RepID=A0A0A9G2D2_ARUDO